MCLYVPIFFLLNLLVLFLMLSFPFWKFRIVIAGGEYVRWCCHHHRIGTKLLLIFFSYRFIINLVVAVFLLIEAELGRSWSCVMGVDQAYFSGAQKGRKAAWGVIAAAPKISYTSPDHQLQAVVAKLPGRILQIPVWVHVVSMQNIPSILLRVSCLRVSVPPLVWPAIGYFLKER